MQPGTTLKSKYAEGTLQIGTVAEGEEIPYSKFTVKEKTYADITVEKFAKAVSLEAIKKYGYDVAVQKTDDEFLYQLTANVTDRFYKYLNTGTLKGTPKTFQMALAMAKGSVEDKFKNMHRTVTGVVGFSNILDVYEYLGAANITVQNSSRSVCSSSTSSATDPSSSAASRRLKNWSISDLVRFLRMSPGLATRLKGGNVIEVTTVSSSRVTCSGRS